MAVLVLNSGSSSVEFAVLDPETGARPLFGLAERLTTPEAHVHLGGDRAPSSPGAMPGARHEDAVRAVVAALDASGLRAEVTAVGHRVVHGGERFTAATRIDDAVEAAIETLIELAPLHNPGNLVGIRIARAALAGLPHVAVFDTAFHQTMPPHAYRYALPESWYREHGVRRYGFHGTSHRYVAGECAQRLGRALSELHLLTVHLGNGCSATAIARGESVDTTMGLTPLEGLVMGTRCGSIDPGVLGYIAGRTGATLPLLLHTLNHESGLRGLSGLSNDMRTLLHARDDGNTAAALAIDVFVHRLASTLLGLCASLPRLDAIVFTGGIGEHAAPIRAEVVAKLWPLGVALDDTANARHGAPEGRIDPRRGGPALFVIPTDEERMIARETERIRQEYEA